MHYRHWVGRNRGKNLNYDERYKSQREKSKRIVRKCTFWTLRAPIRGKRYRYREIPVTTLSLVNAPFRAVDARDRSGSNLRLVSAHVGGGQAHRNRRAIVEFREDDD